MRTAWTTARTNGYGDAISERYRAEVVAHLRAATLWPVSSVFYGLSLAVVIVLGAFEGPAWGLTFGQVTAFLFLADVFLHVFTDLPEIYSETQTAIAGWRKILAVLDLPVDVVEPANGVRAPGRSPVGRGRRRALTGTAKDRRCCGGSR